MILPPSFLLLNAKRTVILSPAFQDEVSPFFGAKTLRWNLPPLGSP
jgi:hypothetical protein